MNASGTISLTCAALLMLASSASAQRRAPGAQKPTVAVTIALKAGGNAYSFTGQASCTHAPMASIYSVISEQWSVQQSEGSQSIQLTLWKPKSGSGEMFSMSVSAGGRSHVVNTVKAPGAPAAQGSGTATIARAGSGAIFTIDATAADGTRVTGTIKCDALLPARAEGGE